jgi:hypothetical protein
MGWLGGYDSIQEIKEQVLRDNRNDGYKVIDHASTSYGKHLWVAFQHPKGYKFIAIYLIEKRGGSYAYKDMDESMGPVVCDCPIRLLDQVPMPEGGYAKEWRERVYAHHAKRRAKFSVGDSVLIYGKRYKVIGEIRRSYRVQRESDGAVFRCGASKMESVQDVDAKDILIA